MNISLPQMLLESSLSQQILHAAATELAGELYNYGGLDFKFRITFFEDYPELFPEDVDVYDLESFIEENPEVEKQYEASIYLTAFAAVENAYFDVYNSAKVENGEIQIYREITAPTDWVKNGGLTSRRLGEFWAYDKDAAEAHWGTYDHDTNWLLVGTTSLDSVDWVGTLVQNANPDMEEEKEIRLEVGSPIKLEQVWVDNADSMKRDYSLVNDINLQDLVVRA